MQYAVAVNVDHLFAGGRAAHEYPEVLGELLEAWSLLPPGGFLVGDDFRPEWPGVKRGVWELVTNHLTATEVSAATDYAYSWDRLKPQLEALRSNHGAGGPVLLHGRQWMLQKRPADAGGKHRHDRGGRFDISKSLTVPIATLCERVARAGS